MGQLRVLPVLIDEPGGAAQYATLLKSLIDASPEDGFVVLDPIKVDASPARLLRSVRAVGVAIETGRPSLVHAHGVRAAGIVRLAALFARMPFVVTIHGLHSLRRNQGNGRRFVLWMNRAVLRAAKLVLVLGESDRATVLSARIADPSRVMLARPSMPADKPIDRDQARRELKLPAESLVVLWLGRFTEQKDPWTFVQAMEAAQSDRLIGLMVGDGEMLDGIAEFVSTHLRDSCRLLGWVDDPTVVLAASDVYVNTSIWEGLPQAALEATQRKLALVLTDCPGNRDLNVPEAGVVMITPGDHAQLAATLRDLTQDPSLAPRLGATATSVLTSIYNDATMRREVVAGYRQALGAKRSGRPETAG